MRDDPLPSSQGQLTCLNRQAVAILMAAFGFTTLATVTFIAYVCVGILKTYKQSDGMEAFSARCEYK